MTARKLPVYPTPEKEWPATRYRNMAIFFVGVCMAFSLYDAVYGTSRFWSFVNGTSLGGCLMTLVYIIQNQRRDDRFEQRRRAYIDELDEERAERLAKYGLVIGLDGQVVQKSTDEVIAVLDEPRLVSAIRDGKAFPE